MVYVILWAGLCAMILLSDLKKLISLERVQRNLIKWPMNNSIVLYLVLTICFNFLDAVWASQFQFQFMFVYY